jgi:thiol-disulfide isomerase/thioredoxin
MTSRIFMGAVLAGCLVGCMPAGKTEPEKAAQNPTPPVAQKPTPPPAAPGKVDADAPKASPGALLAEAQTALQRNDIEGASAALEKLLKTEPKNRQGLFLMAAVLENKGMAKAQAGTNDAAIPFFLKAAEHARQLQKAYPKLQPNEKSLLANVFYNEACAEALRNDVDKALAALAEAVDAGFHDVDHMNKDTDFDGIRKDPKFQALMKELPAKIAALSEKHAKELLAEHKPFDFDFSLPNLDGKTVAKKDFAGKVVIADIWGTWCPPCRMEVPHFVELYKRHKAAGLEIVGINYERADASAAPDLIRKFVEENKISYPCVIGDDKTQKQVPGFSGFPTTVFLDRSGKVRLSLVGYHPLPELEAIVKVLLEEKQVAQAKD